MQSVQQLGAELLHYGSLHDHESNVPGFEISPDSLPLEDEPLNYHTRGRIRGEYPGFLYGILAGQVLVEGDPPEVGHRRIEGRYH